MAYTTYSSPLLAHVQQLVRERPATLTIRAMAKDVGLSPTWLSQFSMGKCPHISAVRVETIYTYLTGKPVIPNEQHTQRTPRT